MDLRGTRCATSHHLPKCGGISVPLSLTRTLSRHTTHHSTDRCCVRVAGPISNVSSVWLASPAAMDTFGSSCACAGEGSAKPAPRSAAAVRATSAAPSFPGVPCRRPVPTEKRQRRPADAAGCAPAVDHSAQIPSQLSLRTAGPPPPRGLRHETPGSSGCAAPSILCNALVSASIVRPPVMTPAIRETRRGVTSSCHGGAAAPLVCDVDDRALRDPVLARPERRCRLASEYPPRCGPWNRHSVSTPAIRFEVAEV